MKSITFATLPNRQNVGVVPYRSPLSRAIRSQVKVPAGVAAAAVAVVSLAAAVLANRR